MYELLKQNLLYSLRTMRKSLGFTLTAVLTIGLGIGATTAIFSVVYAVFEPLPYPKPDQLVMVWTKVRNNRTSTSVGDFLDWRQRSTSFEALNGWTGGSFNLGTGDRPEQVGGSQRTPGFFAMEGLPLMLGHDFAPEASQPGNDKVVILSNRLWVRTFNSNRDIIGQQIRLNGEQYTVVGVLGAGIYDRFSPQLWVPMTLPMDRANRESRYMSVMGRLKEGVTLAQAQSELNGIVQQLQTEYPKANPVSISVEPLHLNFLSDTTRQNLWLLLGAVGFLLLIACVNVANLLLARSTSRQREMALRAALGASRLRLFSQLLTESLVLTVLGGAVGVLLSVTIVRFIEGVMPPVGTMIPSEANIRLSVPVMLFTCALSGLAGILVGCLPAWRASQIDLNEVLKTGGRSGPARTKVSTRRALVIVEFALALTLLSSGVLALRSFLNLAQMELGIQPGNVLTFRLPVPDQRLKDPGQIESYYRQMLEKIGAVPGIRSVAVMTGVPGGRPDAITRFRIAGQPIPRPGEYPDSPLQLVTAGYAETLGIRFLQGRSIDEHDTAQSQRVAVVNETFVKRYLPGVDPLKERILINDATQTPVEYQIVGVFQDVRSAGSREQYSEINVPFWQISRARAAIVLKTESDPRLFLGSIATAVNSVDPDMPLAGARTVNEIIGERLATDRFSVILFACFGALGLLLAAGGIYGVMSFVVAQRINEFGICIALGAQRTRVMGMVLKEGTALAIVGAVIGLIGAVLVRRAMQITLYGVASIDLRAFGAMFLLLLIFAWLACLLPAWRASRVEPLDALRSD